MHEAGDVEQDIDGAGFCGKRGDRVVVHDIERTDGHAIGFRDLGQCFGIDIGGDDLCAFSRER